MIKLAIEVSLALLMINLGLQARFADATFVFRHPALLARSVVSMNVIMPLLALSAAGVFALHPAVKVALVSLAMSPMPPFLPRTAMKAGGARAYTVGLLTAASALAVVLIPITLAVVEMLLGIRVHVPEAEILRLTVGGILLPLVAGLGVRQVFPRVATRLTRPAALLAGVVLVAALCPVLVKSWSAMWSLVGNGTLAAIVVLTLAGLAIGHWLGGPRLADRAVLGLATAARHPAVAMAIGGAAFPAEKRVGAAVLLDVVTAAILTAAYSRWMRRQTASQGSHPLVRGRGWTLAPRSIAAVGRRSSARHRAAATNPASRHEGVEAPASADHEQHDAGPEQRGEM